MYCLPTQGSAGECSVAGLGGSLPPSHPISPVSASHRGSRPVMRGDVLKNADGFETSKTAAVMRGVHGIAVPKNQVHSRKG